MKNEAFKKALDKHNESRKELEDVVFENLLIVASQYIDVYGKQLGLCELAEHLCCKIAPKVDGHAWNRIIDRVKKISG